MDWGARLRDVIRLVAIIYSNGLLQEYVPRLFNRTKPFSLNLAGQDFGPAVSELASLLVAGIVVTLLFEALLARPRLVVTWTNEGSGVAFDGPTLDLHMPGATPAAQVLQVEVRLVCASVAARCIAQLVTHYEMALRLTVPPALTFAREVPTHPNVRVRSSYIRVPLEDARGSGAWAVVGVGPQSGAATTIKVDCAYTFDRPNGPPGLGLLLHKRYNIRSLQIRTA